MYNTIQNRIPVKIVIFLVFPIFSFMQNALWYKYVLTVHLTIHFRWGKKFLVRVCTGARTGVLVAGNELIVGGF